jgi:hypothetical protein
VNRCILIVLLLVCATLKLVAQGTAFNYQGRLNDGGSPATGTYDFRFAVYDAVTNGNAVSVSVTNPAVGVTNGLFSVTLDFGAGVFTGPNVWLDLAVRAVTVTNFTPLFPRQPVLPVPYAIFATGASNLLGNLDVAQISGNLPASQVAGASTNLVNFTNPNNTFGGTFTGNGASLSSLNASQLTTGTVADARLSSNVALLNQNQTFTGSNTFAGAVVSTGTNYFSGPNVFTNWANSFSGSFFGNGLVGWVVTNGLTVQAERDHGYMLTNAGLVTVILPPSSSLTNGDIVRVSGAGGGGWLIQPNSGQSIVGNFSSYINYDVLRTLYTATTSDNSYLDVAASADGTRIFYVGSSFNGVEISADSGIYKWSQITGTYFSGKVRSIACSANGRIVYAELGAGGFVQKSTDGGVTWAATTSSATGTFLSCSADGSNLITTNVACAGDGTYRAKFSGSSITISTNGGANWPISVTAPGTLGCLAASSDCTRLLVGVTTGLLYASANQGKSWTVLTSTNQDWSGAWMSPDGSKFAAAAIYSGTLASGVYSGSVSPLPNTFTTNSIIGSKGSAVELQYLGNSQFMPVSSTGIIWAN